MSRVNFPIFSLGFSRHPTACETLRIFARNTRKNLSYAPAGMIFLNNFSREGAQAPEQEKNAIHDAIAFWDALACQPYEEEQWEKFENLKNAVQSLTNLESVEDWANEFFDLAYEAEGSNWPIARIEYQGEILILEWCGTWTAGRWFRLGAAKKDAEIPSNPPQKPIS
jgi:hypothetical protein